MLFDRDLEKLLASFALLVERTLDRLVKRQLLGLVKWGTDDSLDFHFYNTVIVQVAEQRYTIRREQNSRVIRDNLWFTQRETTIEESTHFKGKSQYRHARSNIYLRNATVRAIDLVQHRIPNPFAELARCIPNWLRPMSTCVEGLRCAEEIIVGATKEEGFDVQDGPAEVWYRTTVERKPVSIRQFIAHCDPALVLGDHYVLAGWGPEEDEAHNETLAEKRSETVREQRTAQLTHWLGHGTSPLVV